MLRLRYDSLINVLFCHINNMCLSMSMPSSMTDIKSIDAYEDGFVTVTSNYGEEYIDLVESLDLFKDFTQKEKNEIITWLEHITIKDVRLESING